jgi:hypothetical protein
MPPTTNNEWMKYASLATQLLVSIGLAVFLGLKADAWLKFSIPLLSWLLPLLVITASLYKIFKETSRKKDEK